MADGRAAGRQCCISRQACRERRRSAGPGSGGESGCLEHACDAQSYRSTCIARRAWKWKQHLRAGKGGFLAGRSVGTKGCWPLRQLVRSEQDSKLRRKLAFDFSINSDPGAIDDLIQMAKSDVNSRCPRPGSLRLAQKAEKKAVGALNASIENDPNFEVKKKAVFALSQLPRERERAEVVHVADTNSNFKIRKEAIFWLGQTNDPRAIAYIEEVLKR